MNLTEIAKTCGVSIATVSFVLNGKPGVRPEKRAAISELLTQQGYTVKDLQEALEQRAPARNRDIIKLIKYKNAGHFIDNNGDYITNLIDGAEQTVRKYGYSLGIVNVDDNNIRQILSDIRKDSQVAGILFLGTEFDSRKGHLLQDLNCPLVVLDTRMQNEPFNCVSIDERDGVFQAISHLIGLGHQKITFARCTINDESNERVLAFDMAVENLGLSRQNLSFIDVKPSADHSFQVMDGYIQSGGFGSTAVFASNDTIALGILQALKKHRMRVPEDVSLVGFDDLYVSAYTDPPLTSVCISKYEIGSLAVERLMQLLQDPESPVVKLNVGSRLVVRATTAPPGGVVGTR